MPIAVITCDLTSAFVTVPPSRAKLIRLSEGQCWRDAYHLCALYGRKRLTRMIERPDRTRRDGRARERTFAEPSDTQSHSRTWLVAPAANRLILLKTQAGY